MKILLVRPDSDVSSIFPPLGLLYLAAYLRAHNGHEVRILDARNTRETPAEIAAAAKRFAADVVGISAIASDCRQAGDVAHAVKRNNPLTIVVMGGAHVTADPTYFFRLPEVDICVAGEGEITFYKLLEILPEGTREELKALPGVYYRNPDGSVVGTRHTYIEDLDRLPLPAWDLLDVESYFRNKKKRASANPHNYDPHCLPMMTSRGCPFHCAYCHDIFGTKVRMFSRERVLEEFDLLTRRLGAREVEIVDDLFNADLQRAGGILEASAGRKRRIPISLTNGLRADRISDEFLNQCRSAGVYRILYAIESASPRIQKLIRKNLNLEKAQENISKTAAKRISVGGYFMLGFPQETLEEMHLTMDFAVRSDLHTATFLILAPFPNTEIHSWAKEHGYDVSQTYEDYYRVKTNLSQVPSETIENLRGELFRRFYLDPNRIYRYLRDTPLRTMVGKKLYVSLRMALKGDVEKGKIKFW